MSAGRSSAAIVGVVTAAVLLSGSRAGAHTVNYQVQQKGLAVRIFYAAEDPASYAEYEIFGPEGDLPHQTGRTDKNGFVAFVPDRTGLWKVKVIGESAHGYHGVTTEIRVDEGLNLESFKKPLAAQHAKFVTGISLIVGVFGILAWLASRRKDSRQGGAAA